VFENRVLRRIFRPKRDEVTGGWRKFHIEGSILSAPPHIIREIKSRRIRCAGHVVRIELWLESLDGRDHSEDLGVDGRMLKWILGK
jgi:hypothetical protein